MAKELPFKGTKKTYMWRYRHDDMSTHQGDEPSVGGTATFERNHTPTVAVGVHQAYHEIALKDKTLDEAFDLLFRQTVNPTITAPTCSVAAKINGASTVEPGTRNVTLTFSLAKLKCAVAGTTKTDNSGSFKLKRVKMGGVTMADNINQTITNGGTYTLSNMTLALGANNARNSVSFSVEVEYTTGNIEPENNIGEALSFEEAGISSQYSLSGSSSITVDLNFYYGWGGDTPSSSNMTSGFLTQAAKTLNVAATQNSAHTQFWILVPPTWNKQVSGLTNMSGAGSPILDQVQTYTNGCTVGSYQYVAYYWTAADVLGVPLRLEI